MRQEEVNTQVACDVTTAQCNIPDSKDIKLLHFIHHMMTSHAQTRKLLPYWGDSSPKITGQS